ncbi:hypothetical protein ACN38_g1270 [Penicillium nordicum]|uniref:Uncharacterized protein n=1 Tax=Penicillium nordicum TaxID=229535 RepID=A0A0M8PBZ8_9EURO|nr:hypothetical protein ACN38_g1270 [Penicillium nordicum]
MLITSQVAGEEIENTTERKLRQARRDRRRGEIMGEAIGIMRSFYLIMGRFCSTREAPPAHILWKMEVRMLFMIDETITLRIQDTNDRTMEGEVTEGASSKY